MTENEYVTFHEHAKHCKQCDEAFGTCPEARRLITQALNNADLSYITPGDLMKDLRDELIAALSKWLFNPQNDALRARGDPRWHTANGLYALLKTDRAGEKWQAEQESAHGQEKGK